MKDGFIRVAAATPKIRVADVLYNTGLCCAKIEEMHKEGVKVLVFPELCLTGFTCNDLFLNELMLDAAIKGLVTIIDCSRNYKGMITFVGLPYTHGGKLYNCMAAVMDGRLLGLIPKMHLPNYNEFYEKRQFTEGFKKPIYVDFLDEKVAFGSNILFTFKNLPELVIAGEICEDLWVPDPPSNSHAVHGATLIVNASASNEIVGKAAYRRQLVNSQSARLVSAYLYCSAGEGESTQDIVFAGHNIISENGSCLAESRRFTTSTIIADLDMNRIASDRCRMSTYDIKTDLSADDYIRLDSGELSLSLYDKLYRFINKSPFVPSNMGERMERCEDILNIQSYGLKKRLEHTKAKTAVIGISGGLDSTLALLVTVRAFDLLGLDRKNIICVTMPGFGTTDRTYNNAVMLTRRLNASLREISIVDSVRQHFKDIGHDENIHDVTYENSQARERTQILMDIANQMNGLVIGTGDLSELALGWATYNGDHMSMYAVNASVPKTLVRHLVRFYADTCDDESLKMALLDVLDTPVSPELLPPDETGKIAQKTEDLVGPYELHDFFLYNLLRFGFRPRKIYRLARIAFAGEYDDETIKKWLYTFTRRFFAQQFKRSCLPDGPKVGSASVSPRGDLRMPSDAVATLWLDEIDSL